MDWLAAGFIVWGVYLVGKKSPYGFWMIAFGACIASALQAVAGIWGLATQSALVVLMNFWAYIKWVREE